MVASPNVGTALDLVERYSALRLQVVGFTVERGGGRVTLRIEDTVGWGDTGEYVALHVVGALCLLLETVSGMVLPDARVAFSHGEPEWVDEYRRRFGGLTLEFGAEVGMIDLPESFASNPCITADATAFRHAVRLCERAEAREVKEGVPLDELSAPR